MRAQAVLPLTLFRSRRTGSVSHEASQPTAIIASHNGIRRYLRIINLRAASRPLRRIATSKHITIKARRTNGSSWLLQKRNKIIPATMGSRSLSTGKRDKMLSLPISFFLNTRG